MSSDIDYAAFELGLARPRLRADLKFSLRESPHGAAYIIEDETNSKFYRVGLAEYTFLSLLDGETTVQSAVAATAAELGIEAFTEAEAAALCKWLLDAGLAEKKRHDAVSWREDQQRRKLAERMQWLNPVMLKIPLGNPDSAVTWLARYTSGLVSWYAAIVWLSVCGVAVVLTLTQSVEWSARQTPIFSRDNWFWLAFAWTVLRVVHESAHAVVCKVFGGRVRQWGIMLLMFIPLPYVDVTTAWRFPSKGARILTSSAGMIAELFLAAIAAIVWCHAEPGLVRQQAMNLVLAASITTLIFNANPLMRFDGYHILADLLDAPNLWTHGRQFVRAVGRRFFLGLDAGKAPWKPSQEILVKSYGIAAAIWKVLITVSLTLAALSLLDGIGLIFAGVAALLWIGIPSFQLTRFILLGSPTEQPNRKQFILASVGSLVCVLSIAVLVPAPSTVTAPVVVQHEPLSIVRNTPAGFIAEVLVQPGQQVSKGDHVCRLENVELRAEVAEVRLQLRASEQRLRTYQSAGETAAMQIEMESTQDLRGRLQELETLASELTIVASVDGLILNGDLQHRLGTFVKPGSEIVSIGGLGPKKAIALIAADASESLRSLQGRDATLRVWGTTGGLFKGSVDRVLPRAQTALPHPSFAAPAGGQLAVIPNAQSTESTDRQSWTLAQPHVSIEVGIQPAAPTRRLLSGQAGIVSIRMRQESLGKFTMKRVLRFLRTSIARNHGL